MQKTKLFFLSILISTLFISCSKDYDEVSESEFINNVLPTVGINRVVVENTDKILIYTDKNNSYVIENFSPNSIDDFLNKLKSKNENMYVVYTTESNDFSYKLFLFQFFTLIIPFLIFAHFLLLWISLRKIIKSKIDTLEKILYAIISIFFPFFGSLIYLTTKKS